MSGVVFTQQPCGRRKRFSAPTLCPGGLLRFGIQSRTCCHVLRQRQDFCIARAGHPTEGHEIEGGRHSCLNLRFPGATEFRWTLQTPEGPRPYPVSGRLECDDGDVLTDWALSGQGIVMKPRFEVAEHLAAADLHRDPDLPLLIACDEETPPTLPGWRRFFFAF